jgi:hypothetical protein
VEFTFQNVLMGLFVSACGFAGVNYLLSPPRGCYDCFLPHGIPFTYYHEGDSKVGMRSYGPVWLETHCSLLRSA